MEDQEIINSNQVKSKRSRIKGRYSIKYYSAYSHYRVKKKFKDITREDCARIIALYFKLCADDLAAGNKIVFQNQLGGLYVTKELKEVLYNPETGEIKNNLPINIWESLKLWKQKPELRGKTFVRFVNDHSNGYVFTMHFQMSKAKFKNKNIYNFQFTRPIKKNLTANILDKKVDAYTVDRKEFKT